METNKEKKSFSELLQASFKSNDTEEWLDVHFTRPIGLVFALLWNSMNIHPNVITILSIFLGIGSGYMFIDLLEAKVKKELTRQNTPE